MARPPKVISEVIGKSRYFKDWEADRLISYWTDELPNDTSYKYRDALVKQMLRKGTDPLTWMKDRDESYGLYPDIDDPDFAARLYKKAEFASLASSAVSEDTCSKSRQTFETTAVQRLVSRFLHPSTPYNGLLLNHGVGVGKTCSAITVAETFLEIMPHNRVYILAPPAISEGFKKTIFDISKLQRVDEKTFEITGERWISPQCTGMTYLRLAGVAASEDLEEIEREVNKLIRRRYKIMGYGAFANMILAEMAKISPDLDSAVRDDFINADLIARFSDHLVIVDEAHNLRDVEAGEIADDVDPTASGDAAEGKKLTPILQRILAVCEGLRLMLMTATPMYDTAPEILFLMNLLILNDSKDAAKMLRREEIFDRDGRLLEGAEKTLAKYFRRYVSYMRGENPNTFPLRLTPDSSAGADFMSAYPERSIKRSEGTVVMTSMDIEIMSNLPLITHYADPSDSKVGETLVHYLSEHAKAKEDRTGAVGISDMILDQTMQIANIIYPDGTFGSEGWNNYFKDPSKEVKRKKRRGERGGADEGPSGPAAFEYVGEEPIESIFADDGLVSHAPKIAAIVESITKARGISFVFSRYVRAGALPLAIALELAGWCRVLADGTPAPLLIRDIRTQRPKYYYVLLTSDKDISPNFKGLLSYATTFKTGVEAATGSKVKAIIGSQVASEGLDLKCIRELHIMDPWYHLNRIEQIEGRGVRFCSHAALPLEERNCLIYLHAVTVPDYETADLYAYRLAVRKAQPIGMVSRLMKINAWDCMLNRSAILLEDLGTRKIRDAQGKVSEEYELADKPFTSFCDFMDKCEYMCTGRRLKRENIGSNKSTYRESDFRRVFAEKQSILTKLFSEDGVVAEPLEKILDSTFEDLPRSMAIIGLRAMLGNVRIKHKTGIYGTLILQNGYIVFQPDKVTDTAIPLALRYGRAYGPLPRSIRPLRGTILQSGVPVVEEDADIPREEDEGAAAPVAKVIEDDATLRANALTSLTNWMAIVERIMSEPDAYIEPPTGFKKERFYGLRWLYHHFGELEETPLIAARWWMDNVWSYDERNAVLADWVSRFDVLSGDEKTWAGLYVPAELYNGKIRGYMIFDPKELKIKNYCLYKKSAADKKKSLGICPSTFDDDVYKLLPAPVNRETDDTGEVFGFQATIKGITVFKTVHKPSAEGRLTGAECDNDSNVLHHHPRVLSAMKGLETFAADDDIREFLLDINPDAKPSKKEKESLQKMLKLKYDGKESDFEDFHHLHELSLLQVCPYLEFLLRYMDLKRIGDKRWFMGLVDASRALPSGKKAIKMT
jgi:superfamily II DNA or RNA helicase